jgi:hypothetical protein
MAGAPFVALLAVAVVFSIALGGCGGSDSEPRPTQPQESGSSAGESQPAPERRAGAGAKGGSANPGEGGSGSAKAGFEPKPHHDSGGGSAQFRVPGGDNSVQEFGEEASESELRAAARAFHGFLDARAAENWSVACGYLSAEAVELIAQASVQAGRTENPDCAASLQLLNGVPRAKLVEAAEADVGSLRIEGKEAFVIYRDAHGTAYVASMTNESGRWKLDSTSGTPLE